MYFDKILLARAIPVIVKHVSSLLDALCSITPGYVFACICTWWGVTSVFSNVFFSSRDILWSWYIKKLLLLS